MHMTAYKQNARRSGLDFLRVLCRNSIDGSKTERWRVPRNIAPRAAAAVDRRFPNQASLTHSRVGSLPLIPPNVKIVRADRDQYRALHIFAFLCNNLASPL